MIKSISDFLPSAGLQYRIFDLGRHIQEINTATFARVEELTIPYPSPYLQNAWLGFLLWDEMSKETPMLWFLKLPLDEQGKLIASDRDLFLAQLLSALGSNLNAMEEGRQLASVLEGNPYIFTPSPLRQASLHARINHLLGNPPSQFYQTCKEYLNGDMQQWQQLGIQGIADLTERWQEHRHALINAVNVMPAPVLISFSQCLEDQTIDGELGQSLSQRLGQELDRAQPDIELISALTRGLSQCKSLQLKQDTLRNLLHSAAAHSIELLVTIATRCAADLCNPELNQPCLEKLCQHGQQTFNKVMADLMFSPAIRQHLLIAFNRDEHSELLQTTINNLIGRQYNQQPSIH